MFKQILFLCVSVLLLAMVGCTRIERKWRKEKQRGATVAYAQAEVEAIKEETDTAVERAKNDFEKVKQETDAGGRTFRC